MTDIANSINQLLSRSRLSKFLSVGVVGLFVDNLVLAVVVESTSVAPSVGKLVSAEVAILVMFLLNDQWTFAGTAIDSWPATIHRFIRSNLVRANGVAVALVILYGLHSILGVWYLAANVVGIGIAFVLNYVLESLYTWRIQYIGARN